MALAKNVTFSGIPPVPFNPNLAEGESQELPSEKLQAYLDFDVLLQSIDEVFAEASGAALKDERKIIGADKFEKVKKTVETEIKKYIVSLEGNDRTFPEWQTILALPLMMSTLQIKYVFETENPDDAFDAVELWMASLIVHAPDSIIATGSRKSNIENAFLTFTKAGWIEPAEKLLTYVDLDLKVKKRALPVSAGKGRLRVVQWLHTNFKVPLERNNNQAIHLAAKNGHLRVVEWLAAHSEVNGFEISNSLDAFSVAAKYGHLGVVKFLATKVPGDAISRRPYFTLPISMAIEYGQLEVLKFLATQPGARLLDDEDVLHIERAAKNGHLDVVEWLYNQDILDQDGEKYYAINDLERAFNQIAARGHLSILQWILERTEKTIHLNTEESFKPLIRTGQLPVLQWLVEALRVNVSKDYNAFIREAAVYGQTRVVQWLAAQPDVINVGYGDQVLIFAARHGHLDIVQWVHTQSQPSASQEPFTKQQEKAINIAAKHGHLPVVQWLAVQPNVDCTANDNAAVRSAARFGHIAVVQWFAKENIMDVDTALGMDPDWVETLVTTLTDGAQYKYGEKIIQGIVEKITQSPVPLQIVRSVEFLLRPKGAMLLFREHDTKLMNFLTSLSAAKSVQVEIRQIAVDVLQNMLNVLREETGEGPRKRAKKTMARLTELLHMLQSGM